jgi:hypothetical protein
MTELRVLFAIVEVGGVPEVAQVLGIAPSRSEPISAASRRRQAFPAKPIW